MKRFLTLILILIAVTAFADQRIMNGPASSTSGNIPTYSDTTGKQVGTGLGVVTTVGETGSDSNVPTEQAVREAIGSGGMPAATAKGDIPTATGAGTWGVTSPGTNGYILKYDTSQAGGIGTVDPSTIGSGDVTGPATNSANYIPQWDGADSKTLKNGVMLDTDTALAGDSDTRVPSQKALKSYIDSAVEGTLVGWVNVKTDYYAAGVTTATTINNGGVLEASSTSVTLTSASSYAINHYMCIPGAGAAGVDLVVQITDIATNIVTFTPATSTEVANGITVYHDDTTPIINAIASEKNVYFPSGYYYHTSDLTLNTAGQRLEGAGRYKTYLYNRRTTGYGIKIESSYVEVSQIGFISPASATAGASIGIGVSGTVRGNAIIDHISFWRPYVGVELATAHGCKFHILDGSEFVHAAFWVHTSQPYGDNHMLQLMFQENETNNTAYGILVTASDISSWTNCKLLNFKYGIYIDSTNDSNHGQAFINCSVESASANPAGANIEFVGSSSYSNMGHSFTGGDIGGQYATYGVKIGRYCKKNKIFGTWINDSLTGSGIGIYIDGSDNEIVGNNIDGNYEGISLGQYSTNNTITGNAITANGHYGILINSAADYYTIVGNTLYGNTTGAVSGAVRTNTRHWGFNPGYPGIGTPTSISISNTAPGIYINDSDTDGKDVGITYNQPLLTFVRNANDFGAFEATLLSFDITAPAGSLVMDSSGYFQMPAVYSKTVGSTNRDLYIDDSGWIGYVSSLRELKDEITPLSESSIDSENIYKLSPVSFKWKKDGVEDFGLIAEEVEKEIPELCEYNKDGTLAGVKYSKLPTLLLQEIKKLKERIDELENK